VRGQLCLPGCNRQLVSPDSSLESGAVIAELAHIVADSREGPRGAVARMAFLVSAAAQGQTQTSVTHGQPTQEVNVERGTVVLVDGNDLVVKIEDGSLRHIPNVPESTRVDVGGKQLGIHDLQPGMKLEQFRCSATTLPSLTRLRGLA